MKKRSLFWKFTAFALFGILLTAVFTFTSCNNDDDEETPEETLAGVYRMEEAVLTSDVVDAEDSVIIPSGTPVTEIMAGGIFGASPCDNPANSAVDLQDGGKLFFVCVGTESGVPGVDAGSWSENATLTQLTLSLNATVVPPIGFDLTIINLTTGSGKINGTIPGVPLPGELLQPFFPTVTFPALPQLVSADVQFGAVPE
jgi:hypothetical protein